MSSPDTLAHVRAGSPFVDDLPEPAGTLHCAVFTSPVAHAAIRSLDLTAAAAASGVRAVFTAADIPGWNQEGIIIEDEPLLAEGAVHYIGQPVALIVAETAILARQALAHIVFEFDELKPQFDPREAAARGELITPARTLSLGDIESVWDQCRTIVSGRVDSGGQEHFYLETQASMTIPEARGRLRILSATQAPSAVQRIAARVLACQMHDIEVEVQRLGGAFGGKEEQATPWAVMTALAAQKLQRPVKLVLSRHDDMAMTGKRHPYSTDYRLGLDSQGKFLAFEATYYQNAGAAADLSSAILERSLYHATNAYFIPNVRVTGLCCRTNLPPFTAFRGFGAPQAMFVMEAAIAAAAKASEIPALSLQRLNLFHAGDELPFGMKMAGEAGRHSFETALSRFDVEARKREIARFNEGSSLIKRGLALMPLCFGISFTNKMLNQAGALVHIYADGSVSVSAGAVEMGQGVSTKLRRMAAMTLGIGENLIRLESTSTARVANMSPTAASTGADLNGVAVVNACRLILERLKKLAAELGKGRSEQISIRDEQVWLDETRTELNWKALVQIAYSERVDLSAHAFYATPNIDYDRQSEKGSPFAYHVRGAAVVEARLDVLRATAAIESVGIIHDAGRSLELQVDQGQVEGAVVQGIGWMTLEELVYAPSGRLLSDSAATYKIPDLHFAPKRMEVVFLEDPEDPSAVMQSKAIGEPPFMYGIGAYFAIRKAIQAVRAVPADFIRAPMTNEQILRLLEGLPLLEDSQGDV